MGASKQLEAMIAAWDKYRKGDVPRMIDAQMNDAMVILVAAINARQPAEARQAALNVAQANLDLEFQYRPITDIELSRSQLWTRQLVLDAALKNYSAIKGDVTTLEWLWQRFEHTLEASKAKSVTAQLAKLRSAANAGDIATTTKAVMALQNMLAELNSTIR
jgi:hypothetical protein